MISLIVDIRYWHVRIVAALGSSEQTTVGALFFEQESPNLGCHVHPQTHGQFLLKYAITFYTVFVFVNAISRICVIIVFAIKIAK